jgi:hypothetical protein
VSAPAPSLAEPPTKTQHVYRCPRCKRYNVTEMAPATYRRKTGTPVRCAYDGRAMSYRGLRQARAVR